MAKNLIWGTPWDDGGYAWGWAPNDGLWLTWDGFKSTGLVGTDGDDDIYSFGGNDVLSGEGGNDMLDGGEGADLMNGGDGNDTYYVDNVGDVVADFSMLQDANGNPASGGYDIVYSSVSFTLGIGLDELFLVEGSAAADGTGNALDNKIHGNANENVLRGEDGDDTLYGEGGDDELIGDRGFSVQGDDWLYGGADNDTLRGAAAMTISMAVHRATRSTAATMTTFSTAAPAATPWTAALATMISTSITRPMRCWRVSIRAMTRSFPRSATP
jgi:Ca2+-binding RTX toxin-like protein